MRAVDRRNRRYLAGTALRSFLVAAMILVLTACGSGARSETTPTPDLSPTLAVTPIVESTPATPVALDAVVFATGIEPATGAPARVVTEVPQSTSTIYAFVKTGPLPAGTTLTADWTIDGTPIPGISQSVRVDHARAAGWIEFHLDWTARGTWPRGALGITISVDGEPTRSGSVQIVAG